MSDILFFAIILAGVILAAKFALKQKKPADKQSVWPYTPTKLLSKPEQILYFRLRKALPEHLVFAQVQLSQILKVKKGNNFQTWLNKISRLSADFVITDKSLNTVAVIELDDSTHHRASRKEADARKDKAITSAGLKIIRWHVKEIPSAEEIPAKLGLVPTPRPSENAPHTKLLPDQIQITP